MKIDSHTFNNNLFCPMLNSFYKVCRFFLSHSKGIDYMPLYGKRKSLDSFILVFYHQFFALRKNGRNNVLSLKLFPDKVLNTINLDFTMSIHLPYKGDFSFRNGNIEPSLSIHVGFETKPYGHMSQRLPQRVSEYSRKPCTMVFLGKPAMRFLILIIPQKSLVDFPQSCKGRTRMSFQHPFLPKIIKTLNRGISSRLSLWNKYHVNTQKQMKTNNLRNTVRISTTSRGSHFIVHLRYIRNSNPPEPIRAGLLSHLYSHPRLLCTN